MRKNRPGIAVLSYRRHDFAEKLLRMEATMIRLGRPKFVEPALDYECNRCGESLACVTPSEVLQVNTHRLLHLAIEWDKSLKTTTGWVTDDDGGMRPVVD